MSRNNTPTPARGRSSTSNYPLPAERSPQETGDRGDGRSVTSPARAVINAAIGFVCAVIGVGAYIVAGVLS